MKPKETKSTTTNNRRKLVQALAVGGTGLTLKAAPVNWSKPVVASVMLPAHGQGSECLGTVGNCPDGLSETYGGVYPGVTRYINVNVILGSFDDIDTVNGYTLTGSDSIATFDYAYTYGCCDSTRSVFRTAAFSVNSGTKYMQSISTRLVSCESGGILGYSISEFNGSHFGSEPGIDQTFVGANTRSAVYCDYFDFSFCFAPGTRFVMKDGSFKSIEDIQIGDAMKLGGRVTGTIQGDATKAKWYKYGTTLVTGEHAVKEGGEWKRIRNTDKAIPAVHSEEILYTLNTEHHRLVAEDNVVYADYDEVDLDHIEDQLLTALNEQEAAANLPKAANSD